MMISTDAQARVAGPVAGRQTEHPISKAPGLALRVTPAGKKSWSFRYRDEVGRQHRLTLGVYPGLSLADARQKAWDTLGSVAKGGDPVREKKVAKAKAAAARLSTVEGLVEAYLAAAAEGTHKPNSKWGPKRASTLALERYYLERFIRPRLGDTPVADLDRAAVQSFLEEVGKKKPSNARHCRDVLREAFNFGIRREVAYRNPAQLVSLRSPPSERERVLTDAELRTVWRAASDTDAVEGLAMARGTGLAICLAMLTLQRGGEVCGIHAREIDRARRLWTIPGERTKNHRPHVVPLSDAAMDVLGRAFAIADPDAEAWDGHAFPSSHNDGPITRHALSRAMKRLTTLKGIEDATPHDLRRTGSSHVTGEKIGESRFILSRVLNQISDTGGAAKVTQVYDRNEYLAEKRRALEAWAEELARIASSGAATG